MFSHISDINVASCDKEILSFSSKCGHVTEKHVLIGCKHDMFALIEKDHLGDRSPEKDCC